MSAAPVAIWCATSVPREVRAFLDRVARAPDVVRVAVMPDVHLAGDACVGTAIATRRTLRPELLGSDLGCGVAAMHLGSAAERLRDPAIAQRVLGDLSRAIPTHRGPVRELGELTARPLSTGALERVRARDGAVQLGTIGRGNHFVELQQDEADGALWLMVHSGSRALGPAIQRAHLERAHRDASGFSVIDGESDEARAYLGDLTCALEYARANRRAIAERVAEVVAARIAASPDPSSWVECHHDDVARESHEGEALWVHRKGAVAADEGAPVLIPGSMGTSAITPRGAVAPRRCGRARTAPGASSRGARRDGGSRDTSSSGRWRAWRSTRAPRRTSSRRRPRRTRTCAA